MDRTLENLQDGPLPVVNGVTTHISTWTAKCPIFWATLPLPKTSNYCLKNRALGFPGSKITPVIRSFSAIAPCHSISKDRLTARALYKPSTWMSHWKLGSKVSKLVISPQDGPLPVINGVVTPINGLIN